MHAHQTGDSFAPVLQFLFFNAKSPGMKSRKAIINY